MKALTLFILMTVAISATNGTRAQSEFWSKAVGAQLAEGIRSDSPEVQKRAIQTTHTYALYRKDLDLRATVPALVDVYKNHPSDQYRLAAVAALFAMGNEDGMQAVRGNVTRQTDERVQITSILALHDFYGDGTFANSPEILAMAKDILENMKDRQSARPRPTIAGR